MHIHIRRAYKIVIIASAVLFLILGVLALRTATLTSLDNKQSALLTSLSEVNNKLQTIKVASLNPGQSSEGDFIINQAGEAKTMVQEFDYPDANAFERLFHAGTATELDSLNQQAREANDVLSDQLNTFNDSVSAMLKFIEYSPAEDFAQLGQDANNDAERIERTITAFKDLNTNQSVTDAQREQLLLAVAAAAEFKQSANLPTFSESIESVQKEIIMLIGNDIEQIAAVYNEQYNQLLYQ